MITPRQILRLMKINFVLVRRGLDEIILATHLFRPFRFLLYLAPWVWFRPHRPWGERIRLALEDLGPVFVKFGQVLSTRRDLLPPEVARELARLQDRVPSFPPQHARGQIERAYGCAIEDIFERFDDVPLASASIAQVHTARLKDGREVVVKVLRPGIERVIRRDVSLLYFIAGLAEKYWKDGRRLRPREVVSEYEKTIIDELDLMREAANAAQLRRNFRDSVILYIPDVDWPHTRREVMVMERINGIPVSDTETLRARGTNMRKLAERGVEIFFTQVFRDNFFHADMHPGNIFVSAEDPEDPRYLAVDFGIMGTLSPTDQHYLAQNFLAFFNRDYRRVAELHVESEWVPAGTRVDEFESAIRTVCEPIFNRPLKDISFGQLLLRLFQTARRFDMEVQPQLVLLQKTLLNVEGLGRELYPDLDLWETAKPFLERWMREQLGVRQRLTAFLRELPETIEEMQRLPGMMRDLIEKADSGRLRLEWHAPELERMRRDQSRRHRRLTASVAGGSLVIGASLLAGLAVQPLWLSWVLGAGGAVSLLGAQFWPGRD